MPIIKRYDPSFALLGEIGATIGAQRVAAQQAQQQQAAMARMQAMEMQQQGALERQAAGFEQQKELMGLRTQAQVAAATQADQRARERAEYDAMLRDQGYKKRITAQDQAKQKRLDAAIDWAWKRYPGSTPEQKKKRRRLLDQIHGQHMKLRPQWIQGQGKIRIERDPKTGYTTVWQGDKIIRVDPPARTSGTSGGGGRSGGLSFPQIDKIVKQAERRALEQLEEERERHLKAGLAGGPLPPRFTRGDLKPTQKEIDAQIPGVLKLYKISKEEWERGSGEQPPAGAGTTPPTPGETDPGSLPPIDWTKDYKVYPTDPPKYFQKDENGNWIRVSPGDRSDQRSPSPPSRPGQLYQDTYRSDSPPGRIREESDRTPRGQAPPADAPPRGQGSFGRMLDEVVRPPEELADEAKERMHHADKMARRAKTSADREIWEAERDKQRTLLVGEDGKGGYRGQISDAAKERVTPEGKRVLTPNDERLKENLQRHLGDPSLPEEDELLPDGSVGRIGKSTLQKAIERLETPVAKRNLGDAKQRLEEAKKRALERVDPNDPRFATRMQTPEQFAQIEAQALSEDPEYQEAAADVERWQDRADDQEIIDGASGKNKKPVREAVGKARDPKLSLEERIKEATAVLDRLASAAKDARKAAGDTPTLLNEEKAFLGANELLKRLIRERTDGR